jgi:hypothetical protein
MLRRRDVVAVRLGGYMDGEALHHHRDGKHVTTPFHSLTYPICFYTYLQPV